MFEKIIKFSIKNKMAIGAMTALLVIWGVYSLSRLPIDAVPDITNNQVQVITLAPTLGAQEVEQIITAPIELSMANVPDVIEKRSISRSGISVITIVFKDKVDVYWARAQINERLKEAEAKIPQGVGEPSLAPITTGLGEIYQYVLHTKPGYEKKYSAMDLRTMQDWIIKTQLAGTPGVAEVSGWGGYVKQYEIAVDNEKLNSLNLTVVDIFEALEKNNENTGGSYIEQRNNTYFIRGLGQIKTLTDIEKIVVKNINNIPILIRDVATVQYGNATRYGAVTRNGEGEVVAGITLMLKGENFNQVIKNVKERMTQVQKSLPEGVIIEPFIDRTELVGRAIGTVRKNLIEGALIVIFILVLLLGNLRAGLVVASVIPLSMLFAFSLMKLFGVSGNLMSLGAIDFGLIVDGAVIIVESVVHRISMSKHHHQGIPKLSKQQMDDEVFESSRRMMNSAAFGQIIILIVYLPLLSLIGIEGKMFKPMAQTVAFAILGAFILSLTYVPMMSSLFLSRKTTHRRNISDRIIDFLKRIYTPMLASVLRFKKLTITIAVLLFAISIWIFSKMGGEFIPNLEEGDLTVEISMAQGTSLTQVVETFGKAEKILKENFPEVKQVVTRIGSSEIPTDPMPIERGDMMVAMKPKEEWKTAKTKEEMMEKMEEALSVLPGVNMEITQPMQMRFNELMTGIRQDVAIKIYGDDLDILTQHANKVAKLIAPIKGVGEPFVEKVTGLPQVIVEYNRDKMAQYGLNISDVNMILKTAFAGNVSGVVFEGEKRFDMVVRLQRNLRENIVNIENLYIPLPSGSKVPLDQVAKVEFKDAPAQVSREDGKRRIYVGFNVRGRDVERTVADIQQVLDQKLKLPTGYYITYGGQFQNLKEAKQRLSVAVPVAMFLILLLLYITFRSFSQMLLIFTAVPLATIGGVFALLIRGMPFSISAGVGFIALFGVAVLNGIVLIGYFNQLKQEGMTDIYQRVIEGTRVRLRPVIMTASVASLGFLPMALSTGAGAEVQKPLATVVIGGLITATILTLFVLPALYILFSGKIKFKKKRMKTPPPASAIIISILFCILPATIIKAQTVQKSLDETINIAVQNNYQLKSSSLSIRQNQLLQRTAYDIEKTNFLVTQDPTSGGNIDNSIGVTQTISLPGKYKAQSNFLRQQTILSEKSLEVAKYELIRDVKLAYYNLIYGKEKLKLLNYQDSLYRNFNDRAQVRYNAGETSNLERLTAETRYREIQLQKRQAEIDITINQLALQRLVNTTDAIVPLESEFYKLAKEFSIDTAGLYNHPIIDYYKQRITVAEAEINAEKKKLLPDFNVGYFHQFVVKGFDPAKLNRGYTPSTRIAGLQLGVAVPIFSKSQKAKIEASKVQSKIAQTEVQLASANLNNSYYQLLNEYLKLQQAIDYYQSIGNSQANELLRISRFSYEKGEIGYIEFIQNITQAISTQLNYIETVREYNEVIIQLNSLKGK
ncbi:CusA/CzcA family heavy metal efflux RND transporter [Flavihumibacter sp. UBA7668]|uniref:CusA/CzcA family heavy metal efflux RND transporter n=1 Tax=Flavihumibacter sp. UBA7668 TaxID=1946542 RepID=UPI0025C10E5D|nr:CusA/CzcA family heavy metal efflux RND transporter [Flavihumibacter sp. UBA7668]